MEQNSCSFDLKDRAYKPNVLWGTEAVIRTAFNGDLISPSLLQEMALRKLHLMCNFMKVKRCFQDYFFDRLIASLIKHNPLCTSSMLNEDPPKARTCPRQEETQWRQLSGCPLPHTRTPAWQNAALLFHLCWLIETYPKKTEKAITIGILMGKWRIVACKQVNR